MPAISVIIVNYNSGQRLQRCVERLERQTFRDFEILVFDNASSDGSLERAGAVLAGATVVKSKENLGFALANNRAAKLAKGVWLAFLNPDAYAERDWLEKLHEGVLRYPFADAFGSTQLNADNPDELDGAGDVFHVLGIPYRGHFGWPTAKLPREGECFAPCAAAAMYRAETFNRLGGFDERFFCYGEDIDLGFRLRLSGGRAVQLSGARVLHEGSGVTGRYSDFTVYHGNRNRIWTTYKNMPAALYWPLAPLRLAADLYLCLRAFSVGRGRVYLRAVLDGYGGLPRFAADRRRLQKGRKVSAAAIAGCLVWSPFKLTRREARLTPIQAHGG